MGVDRVIVIAQNPALVARLLPVLDSAGFAIDALSFPGSRLGYSRHVDGYAVLAPDEHERIRQLKAVTSGQASTDWVILGSDEDLGFVADASTEHPELLRLLPVEGQHVATVYSKIGTALFLQSLGVRQPRFAVAAGPQEVQKAAQSIGLPVIVKPDRGSSGTGTFRLDRPADGPLPTHTEGPHLVEEFISGNTTSIDLLVVDGQVALAPYSRVVSTVGEFGVSVEREYLPLADDRLREDLARIAAGFGGLWFGNVSAIRRPDGTHAIFEVDLRPNAWHAYAERLGYPLAEALRRVRAGGAPVPAWQPGGGSRTVVNVTRALKATLEQERRHMRALMRPTAWRNANRGDFKLTYREARDFARWLVLRRRRRLLDDRDASGVIDDSDL